MTYTLRIYQGKAGDAGDWYWEICRSDGLTGGCGNFTSALDAVWSGAMELTRLAREA